MLLQLVAPVLWSLGLLAVRSGSSFVLFAALALLLAPVLIAIDPALRQRLVLSWRDVVIGLGGGAVMTACTYPLFHLARALVPALAPAVGELYAVAVPPWPAAAAGAALVLITAVEELVWRGSVVEALRGGRASERVAALASLGLYGLSFLLSGSLLLALVGVLCGAVWTLERVATGRLVAPLLTHAVWSTVVLLAAPVYR